jgi:hypothetical protein
MEELRICYENEAYKAAIILAGSLLEAFLFDWLSNEPGSETYGKTIKYKLNEEKKKGTFIADNLNGYIEGLQDKYGLKKPPLDVKKAIEIKDFRNYVHPTKLFKVNDDVLNEVVCKKVYSYLQDIVNYRYSIK